MKSALPISARRRCESIPPACGAGFVFGQTARLGMNGQSRAISTSIAHPKRGDRWAYASVPGRPRGLTSVRVSGAAPFETLTEIKAPCRVASCLGGNSNWLALLSSVQFVGWVLRTHPCGFQPIGKRWVGTTHPTDHYGPRTAGMEFDALKRLGQMAIPAHRHPRGFHQQAWPEDCQPRAAKRRFAEEKIEFAYPTQTVYVQRVTSPSHS